MKEARKKLGAGVVGLGVGEQHASTFAGLAGTELLWLLDFSSEQAKAVQGRIGKGQIAKSYDEILEDSSVDIISIATFDHLHFDEVKAALDAGKHVFVEKPLCRTGSELQELHDAWFAAGRPHLRSNLVLREAPLYGWLKTAIEEGQLGEIYAFDGDYLYGRLDKITTGWRGDVPGYSVMEGGGIHLIDLMHWLTGETPSSVATVGNKIATRGTEFAYDDFMASTFQFPSGVIGRITANFGCMHRHQHVVRVFGTKATFIYDDQGPRLHTSRDGTGDAESIAVAALPDGKGVLIPSFVDAILAGVDSGSAAKREFDLISACAAADRSMQEKTTVDIGYLK